jgi:hypothetical protein
MSYDPPQSPRHQAGHPWPAQSYHGQSGYADAFDGARPPWRPTAAQLAARSAGPLRPASAPQWDGYGNDEPWNPPAAAWNQGQRNVEPDAGRQVPPELNHEPQERNDPQVWRPEPQEWNPEPWHADPVGEPEQEPRGLIASAMIGFLGAAVAIGVATLAAAFFRPQASPIIAVGEAFIDRTPPALKNFAVEKFGENDKTMLLLGMYVTIVLLAMTIGILARRRIAVGVVGVAVFGLFGALVAYTRPASKPSDVIPSIIGGIAGVFALLWLAHAAQPQIRSGKRLGVDWRAQR